MSQTRKQNANLDGSQGQVSTKGYVNSSSGTKQRSKLRVLIAHALDYYHGREGGARRYFQLVIDGLLKTPDVELTVLGMGHKADKNTWFNPIVYETGSWLRYMRKLFPVVRKSKVSDNTIVHTGKLDVLLPFFLLCPNSPKVLSSDTPMFYVKTWPFPLYNLAIFFYNMYEKWAVKRLDAIATDERTKKYFLRRYPWLEPNIHIVEAGVDLDKFRPLDKTNARRLCGFSKGAKIVMFAGRLEPVKDVPYLIEAFGILKSSVPGAKLVIVGTGTEESKIRNIVISRGIEDVLFWGEQPPDKMPILLNCADVLALCSTTEGSPLIVREALACGVPVVSKNVGDVPLAINKPELGEIVLNGPKDFANALFDVLSLPSKITRSACRKKASEYDQRKLVERVLSVYMKVSKSN